MKTTGRIGDWHLYKTFAWSGFSITELLVVMAILATVAGLVAPAFNQIGGAGALASAGNQVANMVNLARTQALARNSMTALVVATDSTLEQAYRAVAVFELAPRQDGQTSQTTDWRQISKWETFRNGVIVDPTLTRNGVTVEPVLTLNQKSDSAATPGVPAPALPSMQISGKPVGSFRYLVFLPGGSLLSGQSKSMNLKEGYFPPSSTTPVFTHAANYYGITILPATGRTIITRP
jgi:prepilin-type N-terminal cleavage/methylation domain-containing protein